MLVQRLSRLEAQDLLRHCVEQGEVIPGFHFRQELANEKLSFEDAWVVLKCGRIHDEPEHDVKSREWKYRVEGHEPGGRWLAIVFSFKEINRAFLITVFSVQSRSKTR